MMSGGRLLNWLWTTYRVSDTRTAAATQSIIITVISIGTVVHVTFTVSSSGTTVICQSEGAEAVRPMSWRGGRVVIYGTTGTDRRVLRGAIVKTTRR